MISTAPGAAVLTVHHTRKAKDSEAHAGDMDAGRGASALAAAARIAITLARMTKEKAKQLGTEWGDLGKHLRRIDDAKQNYAPPAEKASWFVMDDTKIANGERVGVPVSFDISEIAERAEAVKLQDRMAAKIFQTIATARTMKRAEKGSFLPGPPGLEQARDRADCLPLFLRPWDSECAGKAGRSRSRSGAHGHRAEQAPSIDGNGAFG